MISGGTNCKAAVRINGLDEKRASHFGQLLTDWGVKGKKTTRESCRDDVLIQGHDRTLENGPKEKTKEGKKPCGEKRGKNRKSDLKDGKRRTGSRKGVKTRSRKGLTRSEKK